MFDIRTTFENEQVKFFVGDLCKKEVGVMFFSSIITITLKGDKIIVVMLKLAILNNWDPVFHSLLSERL